MMINKLLMELGITPNYSGYSQVVAAVTLIQKEPDAIQMVCKWLYPVVAREYGTTWKCVERNIRTVTAKAWSHNPNLLCKMTGFQLSTKPSAAQFISILYVASSRENPVDTQALD